jgi:hypothetical protein
MSVRRQSPSSVSLREPPSPPRGEGSPDAVLTIRESIAGHAGSISSAINDMTCCPNQSTGRAGFRAHTVSHPVDGEGVGSTFLDDGGLWSSDEARAEESLGGPRRRSMDGLRLLAARLRMEPLLSTLSARSAFRPSRKGRSGTPVRPDKGRQPAGRVDNGHAGRPPRRNGKLYNSTGRGPAAPHPPHTVWKQPAKSRALSPWRRRTKQNGPDHAP